MDMIVLNPVSEPHSGKHGEVKRLNNFDGKVLGILDDAFTATWKDTVSTLERLAKERFPGITIKHWMKPILTQPSPKSLIDEIASTADAAVVGLCG